MMNIDTSSWKSFKLEDLFEPASGDTDIKKEHINGKGVNVITAGETNYGILGKTDFKAKVIPSNTITVDMFGKCTYRDEEYKMVTHARVFALRPLMEDFDEKSGLFITTLLNKMTKGFNYSNMCSWSKIKDLSIKLPAVEKDEIDWDYMQERITELEQERITELEQYLIATGLDDYELTDEEKEILATKLNDGGVSGNTISSSGCLKEARKFKIGTLFEKCNAPYKGPGKKQENVSRLQDDEFNIPLINCKDGNNGIMYYGRENDFVTYESVLTIIYNGPPTEGQTYYQEKIGLYTDAYIIQLKKIILNEFIGLYFATSINKSIHNPEKKKYSRGNKATWNNKVENDTIILPIQTDSFGQPVIDSTKTYHLKGFIPDWVFMEKFIRAIEKEVIKDMVDWKDKVIEKTKKVVED